MKAVGNGDDAKNWFNNSSKEGDAIVKGVKCPGGGTQKPLVFMP